jgi:hypothetical protein
MAAVQAVGFLSSQTVTAVATSGEGDHRHAASDLGLFDSLSDLHDHPRRIDAQNVGQLDFDRIVSLTHDEI